MILFMIRLLVQTTNGSPAFNPEAIIGAAIAAKNAEAAAWQASIMAGITLVVLLICGAAMLIIIVQFLELKRCFGGMREKFEKLERNTDGILNQLITATRKLALIEGNTIGRAEQLEEQAGLKPSQNTEKKPVVSTETAVSTVSSEKLTNG